MEKDSVLDILRLIRTKNVGDITFFELIKHFGSAKQTINSLPNFINRNLNTSINIYSKELAEKEIEECNNLGVDIITYKDYHYPALLHQIDSKPPILFAKGNINLLNRIPIAVVGSRNASFNGIAITSKLVKQLIELNILIISGLALGIDTCAHTTALNSGTIAFLGSGINVVYPPQNKKLYQDIINKGLVLSTLPINTEPLPIYFPRRNTYIAAMSLGTLVTEAKLNSGSLITAYNAMNYGRDVFAVPGSPNDTHSQGCNKLIKEGAILVESINDMLDNIKKWQYDMEQLKEEKDKFYKGTPKFPHSYELKTIEKLHHKILPLLSSTPVSIDLIKQEFNEDNNILSLVILELELLGKIIRLPGNKIKLINNN